MLPSGEIKKAQLWWKMLENELETFENGIRIHEILVLWINWTISLNVAEKRMNNVGSITFLTESPTVKVEFMTSQDLIQSKCLLVLVFFVSGQPVGFFGITYFNILKFYRLYLLYFIFFATQNNEIQIKLFYTSLKMTTVKNVMDILKQLKELIVGKVGESFLLLLLSLFLH